MFQSALPYVHHKMLHLEIAQLKLVGRENFFSGVEAIYHLYALSECNHTTVINYIKGCGKSVVFSTTIYILPCILCCFKNSMMCLLCVAIVAVFYLLSSEKNEQKTTWYVHDVVSVAFFGMYYCTKMIQFNALNGKRYTSATVFRLNLVRKTSYHSFNIITTTQNILKLSMKFECFTLCVATVMCT